MGEHDELRERLKSLAEHTTPDPRSQGARFFGPQSTFRAKGLEDHYAQLSELILDPSVPEDIWQHFETARIVYLYSWYAYRLTHVADLHALASVEFALRERRGRGPGARYLGPLLRAAIAEGLLQDRGMRVWQRREKARKEARQEEASWPEEFRKLFGRAYEPTRLTEPQRFVKHLATAMPNYRNELAHGSALLYPQGIHVMELCCDLINQLLVASRGA